MRVGVIVAARGPVPFLREAVDSALAQEPAPDAVVVVDHASSPALEAIPGAGVVRLEEAGGGPAAARDAGLAALDCELVALLDADDVWEPGKLGAQLRALEGAPDAGVVFGRATVVGPDGRPSGEVLPELAGGLYRGAEFGARLWQGNPLPASSALIRREALEAVGGFAPRGGELPAGSDWDLWLRLAAAGYAFLCELDARIRYRRHKGGLTADVSRLAEAALAIHERHASLVDEAEARRTRARDLELLARGRIRERRYAEARAALREAASLDHQGPRERALRHAVAVPVLRRALGRRSPYR